MAEDKSAEMAPAANKLAKQSGPLFAEQQDRESQDAD